MCDSNIQLDYLLLDVDFFNKPKIKSFKRLYGWTACTWLIQAYCLMSRATNGEVDKDALLDLSDEMGLSEKAEEIINYCTDPERNLITKTSKGYTNSRVQKDRGSLDEKRKAQKARIEKYRNKDVTERFCNASVTVTNTLQDSYKTVSPDTVTDTVTDTDTDTEYKINNSLPKKQPTQARPTVDLPEINPPPPENLPAEQRELWELAKRAFEPVCGDEPWLSSSTFMNTGRRPMKQYPNVWISHFELFETLRLYDQKGLKPDEWKLCFIEAEKRAKTQLANGKPSERIAASCWLTGFILDEVQGHRLKDLRIEQARSRNGI